MTKESTEVASPDGRIAARGSVRREGSTYTATITEGALRDWCLQVDGRSSAVQSGAVLGFDAG